MMMHLYIAHYVSEDSIRARELEFCLRRNFDNTHFDHIYLVSECPPTASIPSKLSYVQTPTRPTYNTFFDLIRENAQEDTISIICNADIYFEGSIGYAKAIGKDDVYALSRWDLQRDFSATLYDKPDSQDAWIFRGKVNPGVKADFSLGQPGCDNRIGHILTQYYRVSNPSKTIKSVHVHGNPHRRYTLPTVPPPYATFTPEYLPKSTGIKVLHVALNANGNPQSAMQQALESLGTYKQIDWMRSFDVNKEIVDAWNTFMPQLTFMQVQTPGILNPEIFKDYPGKVINWTGDVRQPLPQWYYDIGEVIDMTLFTNYDDVRSLRAKDINADFLNIGFENRNFHPSGPRAEKSPEIVFMGNNYGNAFPQSRERRDMVEYLSKWYPDRFGVYGSNWPSAAGNLNESQVAEASIYRSCKIAVSQSHFVYEKYSSDRLFRAMGSGAFCLCRWFPGIDSLFDVEKHLDTWTSMNELQNKLRYYLNNGEERQRKAKAGCDHVHAVHTWEHRMSELAVLMTKYTRKIHRKFPDSAAWQSLPAPRMPSLDIFSTVQNSPCPKVSPVIKHSSGREAYQA